MLVRDKHDLAHAEISAPTLFDVKEYLGTKKGAEAPLKKNLFSLESPTQADRCSSAVSE